MVIRILAATLLAAAMPWSASAAQAEPGGPRSDNAVIRLHTGGFWLNLHHFLYVLGRAEAGMSDAGRDAVRHAPAEQNSVLARLSAEDQRVWRAAVTSYARGLSRRDMVHDAMLSRLTHRLSSADPASPASESGIEPAVAEVLDRAATIYRTAWWPRHDAANRARADEYRPMLARHGEALSAFVSRVYGATWPVPGFDMHLSAYTNWAGAYSTTTGPLLVASSLYGSLDGWHGIELLLHESLHQWDEQILARLASAARAANVPVPPYDVVHAMIFATAGEAVRRIVADHVPFAELHGLWGGRSFGPHKARVDAAWGPWLRGEGTLEDALAALVRTPA